MRSVFVLNDQANGYPTRTVETTAARADIDRFVKDGYLPVKSLISAALADELAASVLEIARAEAADPRSELLPERSIYIRGLFDKDAIFHQLLRLEPALSIARTLLGPQPVIPDPLPPLFCYPHQVHCLVYLDRVREREGALCLIPGSHLRPDIRIPLGDRGDQPGQVKLFFEPRDAVLIHATMWHQTIPSQDDTGTRRLLS